jgi:pimeloyl-ACP methyl ester carboxylesterase
MRLPTMIARLLLTIAITSGVASGQVPIVFVHGLNSSGAAWGGTPAAVSGPLGLAPIVPSLPSFLFYDQQSAIPTLIAVGHSNGGMVSRSANATAPQQPMQGIITIGTPHQGALLAANGIQGEVTYFLTNWGFNITEPLIVYAGYVLDDLCAFICPRLYDGVQAVYNGSFNALFNYGYLTNLAGQVAEQTTVLGQMEPGSGFLQQINGGANLGREAGALVNRISIASQSPYNWTSMYAAVSPDNAQGNTNWETLASLSFDALYNYYYDYTDYGDAYMWDKRFNAYLWAVGRDELSGTNYHWCNLIGGWNYGAGRCESDGVVAVWAAQWPGQNAGYVIPGGPGHMSEMTNGAVSATVTVALTTNRFVLR